MYWCCSSCVRKMRLSLLLSLLALSLVQEGACTHLETCDCHEIQELVNATVQVAAGRLEDKINDIITDAIAGINTPGKSELADLEKKLTSTVKELLKPIQKQLDYHLPPPPFPTPTPSPQPLINSEERPAASCKALFDENPRTPTGDYWISTSGSPVKVYCNMDTICANYTGGWMRVANLDMRNTSHQCPTGMTLVTRSSEPTRLCDMTRNRCASKTFSAHGIEYSHVYGRIIGYEHYTSLAFYYKSRGIDGEYIHGVSLTHGRNPRNHIWTFAGASDETSRDTTFKCPCTNTNINPPPPVPSFVGTDYFCDTSLPNHYTSYSPAIYTDDPLWDGEGCGPTNSCCSFRKGCSAPPWFVKDLPSTTTDDIEMRLCRPNGASGSTPIEVVELYVQ